MSEEGSNSLAALRAHLFDAIKSVKAGTLDLDKARVVNDIGRTLVDSAKVEVDYLRTTGGQQSPFIESNGEEKPALTNGIVGITRHILQG